MLSAGTKTCMNIVSACGHNEAVWLKYAVGELLGLCMSERTLSDGRCACTQVFLCAGWSGTALGAIVC